MTRRICVFGDSIVWGAFDEESAGWVYRVQRMFERDRIPAEVYNLGVCGEGVGGVSDRIVGECKARRPTDIVIATGINDASYFNRPTLDPDMVFRRRYEGLLCGVRLCKGAKPLIVGLAPIDERLTHPTQLLPNLHYTTDRVRGIDEMVRQKALESDIPYLPLLDALDIATDLSDGLHPNAAGHAKIAELVYARLTAE